MLYVDPIRSIGECAIPSTLPVEREIPDRQLTISQTPRHWNTLTDGEKREYISLHHAINPPSYFRAKKGRVESFEEALKAIREYVERKNGGDTTRGMVCGICWMEDSIAINTRQLRILMGKCKSAINRSLQIMGYAPAKSKGECWKVLLQVLPELQDNSAELRQWSIRTLPPESVQKEILPPVMDGEPEPVIDSDHNDPFKFDDF